jgi:dihydroorotate dehydrogenase
MNTTAALPRYDRLQSYDWNYAHAPDPVEVDVPAVAGSFEFCGLKVASPLGVAAGPLLNGRWVRYYASLGFDVLTYKTVRSRERACYPLPNLVPVDVEEMTAEKKEVAAVNDMRRTWAVSFGMPSKAPEVWRADVAETRKLLAKEKVLVVSVVATEQPGWSIDDMADDYTLCARWAVESGADAVETNFSCPNVCTSDGQLYQHPREAAICAARVRAAIGPRVPYIVKVGHLRNRDEAAAMVDALAPHVNALAMTNSVAARVAGEQGLLFDGGPRGICGGAILEPSIAQTRLVRQIVNQRLVTPAVPDGEVREEMERILAIKGSVDLERAGRSRGPTGAVAGVASAETHPAVRLVGVGGAFSADDVRRYLVAGAESVHLATAAMIDPTIGLAIRGTW